MCAVRAGGADGVDGAEGADGADVIGFGGVPGGLVELVQRLRRAHHPQLGEEVFSSSARWERISVISIAMSRYR